MKRRIYVLLTAAVILSTGCSVVNLGSIKSYNDDFTGGRRYLLHESVEPREWRTEIGTANFTFEKRVSSTEVSSRIYFMVSRSSGTFGAERKGYIKVGNTIYDIELADQSSAIRYSGGNIISDGVVKGSDLDSQIDEKFVVDLPTELVDAILGGNRMEIRLYFGPAPATYRISGFRYGRVKRLLSR